MAARQRRPALGRPSAPKRSRAPAARRFQRLRRAVPGPSRRRRRARRLFFGEAEDALPAFLRRWRAAAGAKRERLAAAAAGLDGFWVTGAIPAAPVLQAAARGRPPPAAPQPLPDVETAGTARLAVGAAARPSAPSASRASSASPTVNSRPPTCSPRPATSKAACGARTVELDAYNLNSYAGLGPLVEQCVRLSDTVSFKSQRADGIAACPQIIDLERAAGKSSYTLGIEGVMHVCAPSCAKPCLTTRSPPPAKPCSTVACASLNFSIS